MIIGYLIKITLIQSYYHVNEVGYKRTKVKIKIRESKLFELDAKGKQIR